MTWVSLRKQFRSDLFRWLNDATTWTKRPGTIAESREEFVYDRNIMAQSKSAVVFRVDGESASHFLGLTGSWIEVGATIEVYGDREDEHYTMVNDVLAILFSHAKERPYADVLYRGSSNQSEAKRKLYHTLIDVQARQSNS